LQNFAVSVPAVFVPDAGTTLIISTTTVKASTLIKMVMCFMSATSLSKALPSAAPYAYCIKDAEMMLLWRMLVLKVA